MQVTPEALGYSALGGSPSVISAGDFEGVGSPTFVGGDGERIYLRRVNRDLHHTNNMLSRQLDCARAAEREAMQSSNRYAAELNRVTAENDELRDEISAMRATQRKFERVAGEVQDQRAVLTQLARRLESGLGMVGDGGAPGVVSDTFALRTEIRKLRMALKQQNSGDSNIESENIDGQNDQLLLIPTAQDRNDIENELRRAKQDAATARACAREADEAAQRAADEVRQLHEQILVLCGEKHNSGAVLEAAEFRENLALREAQITRLEMQLSMALGVLNQGAGREEDGILSQLRQSDSERITSLTAMAATLRSDLDIAQRELRYREQENEALRSHIREKQQQPEIPLKPKPIPLLTTASQQTDPVRESAAPSRDPSRQASPRQPSDLQSVNDELRRRLAQTEADANEAIGAAGERVRQLTDQLTRYKHRTEELQRTIIQLEQSAQEATMKQEEPQIPPEQLQRIRATIEELERLLTERDQHIEKLNQKLAEKRKKYDSSDEVVSLRKTVAQLQSQLSSERSQSRRDATARATVTIGGKTVTDSDADGNNATASVGTGQERTAALIGALFGLIGRDVPEDPIAESDCLLRDLRAELQRARQCSADSSMAERRIAELERNIEQSGSALAQQSSEITRLRKENEDLRSRAEGSRLGASTVQESETMRRTNLHLAHQLQQLRMEVKNRVEAAQQKVEEAERKRRAAELALADAQQRIAMRDNERITTLQREAATLRKVNAELQGRLESADGLFTVREEPLKPPTARNTSDMICHSVQTDSVDRGAATLTRSMAKTATLKSDMKKYEERVKDLSEKLAAAGRDLADARTALATSQETIQRVSLEKVSLESQLKLIQHGKEDSEALAREVDSLKTQLAASQSEKTALQREIAQLKKQYQELMESRKEAREKAAAVDGARRNAEEASESLQQRIRELEQELERKNNMLVRLRNEVHQLTIGGPALSDPLDPVEVPALRATNFAQTNRPLMATNARGVRRSGGWTDHF